MAQNSPKTRKRLSGPERRDMILKSAAHVFAQSNYQTAKVADIAREADVSEALIYKHFPSKKAIFLEVLKQMSQRMLVSWKKIAEEEEDALEIIRQMGLSHYEALVKQPYAPKVLFLALSEMDDPDILKRMRQDHHAIMSFIREVLSRGVKQGIVRSDPPVADMAYLLFSGSFLLSKVWILHFEDEFNHAAVKRLNDYFIQQVRA